MLIKNVLSNVDEDLFKNSNNNSKNVLTVDELLPTTKICIAFKASTIFFFKPH